MGRLIGSRALAAVAAACGAFVAAVPARAQTTRDGGAVSSEAAPARATVVAELLEPGPSVAACGRVHFVVAMRYRVVRVEAGRLSASEVYVAVSCPTGQRVAYTAGARHRLVLSWVRPWSGGTQPVWHPGRPAPSPVLWAVSVAAAPP